MEIRQKCSTFPISLISDLSQPEKYKELIHRGEVEGRGVGTLSGEGVWIDCRHASGCFVHCDPMILTNLLNSAIFRDFREALLIG